jgi:hypothetical protein
MTYRNSAALTALASLLLAVPAYAGAQMNETAANMAQEDVFATIDADGDNQLTFTEFANFSEDHGISTSVAAQEFSRLAGQETTLDMDSFADFDMAVMENHKMDMKDAPLESNSLAETENMDASISMADTASNTTSVDYGDFAKLDSNSDGKVSFKEYNKMRKSQGMTSTTQAAQEFTRLSNGQAMLSPDQYQMAMSNDVLNQPSYGLGAQTSSNSMNENMDKDMTSDTMKDTLPDEKMSKDKLESLMENNPAGLKQMNEIKTKSHMTNSGVETDLDVSSNPQMKVQGEK